MTALRVVTKPYLLDGPLMTTPERRKAVLDRMARDLASSGADLGSDRDARRLLTAKGYPDLDVALLAGEARAAACRGIVAREMAVP